MIKVRDLAFVRFGVTDLDRARTFLTDFGLTVTHESDRTIAFGTADGNPYAYIAYEGQENEFLGFGFEARSDEDLDSLLDAGVGAPHIQKWLELMEMGGKEAGPHVEGIIGGINNA